MPATQADALLRREETEAPHAKTLYISADLQRAAEALRAFGLDALSDQVYSLSVEVFREHMARRGHADAR